jgi:lipopolysaccharide/colanic/teichoic acid biosynthesis glycosyltransferase
MIKRIFDILFSFFGLIFLLPFIFLLSIVIIIESGWPVFYFQKRVGKNNRDFNLIKFRTMHKNSERFGLITVGEKDKRITKVGFWLRKYKLDELPQLINILVGEMSFVGPRPEVRKYVNLYTQEQRKVLSVKPGLTDYASLAFIDESKTLATYPDPEKAYIEVIMPEKLELNLLYINQQGILTDLGILLKTLKRIVS